MGGLILSHQRKKEIKQTKHRIVKQVGTVYQECFKIYDNAQDAKEYIFKLDREDN